MLNKIKNLISHGTITRNELLKILRKEAKKVDISDFIQCNLQIQQGAECIHTNYKKDCIKSYTDFLLRIKDVKVDDTNYNGQIDIDKLKKSVTLLLKQEQKANEEYDLKGAFWMIYKILSLYSTFIIEEPIHQVGFMFPGGFTVKIERDKFTCPVKENNKDNPSAVCPFCIAEQDENV